MISSCRLHISAPRGAARRAMSATDLAGSAAAHVSHGRYTAARARTPRSTGRHWSHADSVARLPTATMMHTIVLTSGPGARCGLRDRGGVHAGAWSRTGA